MRHGIDRRKLGRDTPHRMAMFANMAASMFANGRIETTLGRAKELRRFVERLVTRGKVDTLHSRRMARKVLKNVDAVNALFTQVAPRFKDRNGGYTRVLKKSLARTGDSAEMAFVEFVDYVLPAQKSKDEKKKDQAKKKEEKELEKQAIAAGKGAKKEAGAPKKEGKKSSSAAGGPKKSTTVRKIST